MIIDGSTAATDRSADYDLVIVGAGPAGISLAVELRDSGLRIALLESGGLEFDPDIQALNDGTVEGNDDEFDLGSSRLRFLGGTSNHWGGHCTPLDPIDFARAPAGFSGWPFPRSSLDPFYARAHDYCDLGAYRYDSAVLAPGDPSLRLLPDQPDVETAVLRQSPPTRFGEKYHDLLAAAPGIDLWLNTTALGLAPDGADGLSRVATGSLAGPPRQFAGRAVVLAAGAIESTRLLMWANAANGTRLGDAGGLLGRCYMDHPSGGAAFVFFDRPQSGKLYWADLDAHADGGVPLHFVWRLSDAALARTGLPNSHYFVIPFAADDAAQERQRRAAAGIAAARRLAQWGLGGDAGYNSSFADQYCRLVGNTPALVAETAGGVLGRTGVARALLKYESEQIPARSNSIRLADETDALGMPRVVLTWSPGADDLEGIRATARHIGTLIGAAGLGRVQLEDHDADPYWGSTTAWHQLGTMRMADSPAAGVVDADCRIHGSRGLYVAGGAVMPTCGRANPTLTIVALTLRLADHLRGELLP
jgi:choline dehydrogenase-like flavoprotein